VSDGFVVRLGWCTTGQANDAVAAIAVRLDPLQKHVHALTSDLGSEFANDALIERALKATMYFADPHSPWHRARNENLNGLVRQYFPRIRDFSIFTAAELQLAEEALNNRPRKPLKFLSPAEVFFNNYALYFED
jgi:IS30 family transposase